MRNVQVRWAAGRQEAVRLPRSTTAGHLRALLAAPAELLRLRAGGRALSDSEPCPDAVDVFVALRGGYSRNKYHYVTPIALSVVFVAFCIAGPVLVAQQSAAHQSFGVVWWVGMGMCIAAAVLLLVLVPFWLYVLCCD